VAGGGPWVADLPRRNRRTPGGRMHAVVINVTIDDRDAAQQGLEQVVAGVKQAPGFVAGYWIRLDDTHGTSIAVFGTEEQAAATKPPAGTDAQGVRMTSISVGEVLASA
jgi:hypothetical protein